MRTTTAMLALPAGVRSIALPAIELPAAAEGRSAQIERGRHRIGEVGLCVDCRAPRLANADHDRDRWLMGTPLPFTPVAEMPWNPVAPPIAGLPNFKDEEAIVFLMTSVRPNGSRPLPPMPACRLSRPEAADVAAYLRSVAPAK